jgi:hypothetical protein
MTRTREERREELKKLAAGPNGLNHLYLILTRQFIPFEKLPLGTLMIEAILDSEYPEKPHALQAEGTPARTARRPPHWEDVPPGTGHDCPCHRREGMCPRSTSTSTITSSRPSPPLGP